MAVGDEDVARVNVFCRNSAQLEECRDEVRRQLLSKCGNRIEASRRGVAQNRQRLGETRQLVEGSAHLRGDLRRFLGSSQQLLALLEVAIAQRLDAAQGADQVPLR